MKYILLTFLIALAATVSSNAQTLQVDPIYIGGTAAFEVQSGTPDATAIIFYSLNGSGPFTLGNGIAFDLSAPIANLTPFILDAQGNGTLGPFPVPSSATAGMQVWFQGVQLDVWANPIYSMTNMVPVTVQNAPNNAPVAADDNAIVYENEVVFIDVLANDNDPDGDAISIVSVSTPANGTALIVSGAVKYTPSANYVGADSFTYTIEDSFSAQAMATVFVEVLTSVPTEMAVIPGGTFLMGDHSSPLVGDPDELPIHSVTLDAFYMDIYEVSNTKFVNFLNNTTVTVYGYSVYSGGPSGERICRLTGGLNHNGIDFSIDVGKYNHPVQSLTWHGAALYCNYLSLLNGRTPCYDESAAFACDFTADGFRLPTEAEWEYASRGGEHTPYYQYPWGSDSIASTDAHYGQGSGGTVSIGNYAANGYGLYDMAGNVYEWCNDWYDGGYYATSPAINPHGAAAGLHRVMRGGGYSSSDRYLRCANRQSDSPDDYAGNVGFRVITAQ